MVTENQVMEILPQAAVSAAVIWLHGLGADGGDFVAIPPVLPVTEQVGIRYLFPNAPMRAVTLNHGYMMRAWFDIKSLDELHFADLHGIEVSRQRIEAMIGQLIASGIPAQRIVLMGFSQGASMAAYSALYSQHALAGVGLIASCLPNFTELEDTTRADYMPFAAACKHSPFLLWHGAQDQVLPLHMGEAAATALSQAGYQVQFEVDPAMGHQISARVLTGLSDWLKEVLPPL